MNLIQPKTVPWVSEVNQLSSYKGQLKRRSVIKRELQAKRYEEPVSYVFNLALQQKCQSAKL